MKGYEKIVSSIVSVSSIRMLIGATSTIYMLDNGVALYEIGMIKSVQAVVILLFGFFIGVFSDRVDRKSIHTIAILISFLWLLLFYLGGIYSSISLFYIAEILNGISLSMIQNNTNGYLVEQFKKDNRDEKLDKLFGQLSKLSFLGMAIASLVGGGVYYLLGSSSFLYTALLMLAVFILSLLLLPDGSNLSVARKMIDRKEFYLVLRKINKHREIIFAYMLYGLLFQIIIQYWQVMVYDFEIIVKNNYWLGIVLFLLMLSQSFAGSVIERKFYVPRTVLYFGTILVLFALVLSISFSSPVIYIISLCSLMFSIRYISILTGVELQSDLKNRFRSKYDMVLNSILRIITAIMLFVVGFIVEHFGSVSILYLGIIMIGINVVVELKSYK